MSKKAEARIAKKLAKELKQKEKSVRVLEEPSGAVARSEYTNLPDKAVRLGANPGSIFDMRMRWTDAHADKDGEWSWNVSRDWGEVVWKQNIKPSLDQFEKLTWAEIEAQMYGNPGKRHRKHHSMPTTALCKEAQDRLDELSRTTDNMFRFRLGNLPRLWGVRIVDEFQIYWYDPTHDIYPVD